MANNYIRPAADAINAAYPIILSAVKDDISNAITNGHSYIQICYNPSHADHGPRLHILEPEKMKNSEIEKIQLTWRWDEDYEEDEADSAYEDTSDLLAKAFEKAFRELEPDIGAGILYSGCGTYVHLYGNEPEW